jgi:hypothetical protein
MLMSPDLFLSLAKAPETQSKMSNLLISNLLSGPSELPAKKSTKLGAGGIMKVQSLQCHEESVTDPADGGSPRNKVNPPETSRRTGLPVPGCLVSLGSFIPCLNSKRTGTSPGLCGIVSYT